METRRILLNMLLLLLLLLLLEPVSTAGGDVPEGVPEGVAERAEWRVRTVLT